MNLLSLGPNSRQDATTERPCKLPTCLTDAKTSRRAVFSKRSRRLVVASGSNGELWSTLRTVDRSQDGTVWGRGGFSLLGPLRNLTTKSFFSKDWPAIGVWFAANYTLSVDGVHPPSSSSCRNKSIDVISQGRVYILG